jgi:TPR repeat protein
MENFKKNVNSMKKHLLSLLFFLITAFPALASLQKGEELVAQGKLQEAIATLAPFAAKNDAHALYLMAVIYLSPQTNHLDVQRGVAFLKSAAFQNYPPALNELAGLYLDGAGVEKNEGRALQYYVQASHLGYGPSQFNCGIMYKNGQGTEKNFIKAYLYLSLAAFNYKDLGDVALAAAKYRDGLVPFLSPAQRQDVLRQVNELTLPPH